MDHCSILLIDDNPHDVELTLTALGAQPQEAVKVVGSGREALEYLHAAQKDGAEQPSLILLDLNMPHMNGLEVLDAIRAEEKTREIPVVILTTSGEERDRKAAYDHGADDYVVKTLDLSQFCEAMERVQSFWKSLCYRSRLLRAPAGLP